MDDMRILEYVGEDYFGKPKYKDSDGNVYVDVDLSQDPRNPGGLHYVTPDFQEPDNPVDFEFEVIGWTDEDQLQRNFRHEYMMLSSLKMKSMDYLYDVVVAEKRWGYRPKELIDKMREYYGKLPVKPEWCTKEFIDNIEKQIKEAGYGKRNV